MQNSVVAVADFCFGKAVRVGILRKLDGGNIGAAVEQSSVTEDQHLFGGGFLRSFFGGFLCGELIAEQQTVKGSASHILRRFAAAHQSSCLLGNGNHLYAVRGKPCGQVGHSGGFAGAGTSGERDFCNIGHNLSPNLIIYRIFLVIFLI